MTDDKLAKVGASHPLSRGRSKRGKRWSGSVTRFCWRAEILKTVPGIMESLSSSLLRVLETTKRRALVSGCVFPPRRKAPRGLALGRWPDGHQSRALRFRLLVSF